LYRRWNIAPVARQDHAAKEPRHRLQHNHPITRNIVGKNVIVPEIFPVKATSVDAFAQQAEVTFVRDDPDAGAIPDVDSNRLETLVGALLSSAMSLAKAAQNGAPVRCMQTWTHSAFTSGNLVDDRIGVSPLD